MSEHVLHGNDKHTIVND